MGNGHPTFNLQGNRSNSLEEYNYVRRNSDLTLKTLSYILEYYTYSKCNINCNLFNNWIYYF